MILFCSFSASFVPLDYVSSVTFPAIMGQGLGQRQPAITLSDYLASVTNVQMTVSFTPTGAVPPSARLLITLLGISISDQVFSDKVQITNKVLMYSSHIILHSSFGLCDALSHVEQVHIRCRRPCKCSRISHLWTYHESISEQARQRQHACRTS